MAAIVSAEKTHQINRIDWHLRLALITSLALGYAVLFASDMYPLSYLPFVLAALGFGYYRFYNPVSPILGHTGWSLVTLIVVVGPLVLVFMRALYLLDALNTILLLLPIVKVYTAKSNRDYLQIFALAFSQIIYGTVINFDLSFGVASAAYLLLVIWGLILLSFRNGIQEFNGQPGIIRRSEAAIFRRRYVTFVATLGPVAISMAVLIFILLPRPGSALASFSFGIQKRMSGFSDTVNIGELGEIKLDQAVAMRVSVEGAKPQKPIYWKGAVLDHFDGTTWTATKFKFMNIERDSSHLFRIAEVEPGTPLIRQTFYMDGVRTRYLMYTGFLVQARLKADQISMHPNGSFRLPRGRNIQQYRVWSAYDGLAVLPDSIMPVYLQIPEDIDPRVAALAKQVSTTGKTALDKGRLIEQHLKTAYTYSLEGGLVPSADPLTQFLFERKYGHCEYFATAMTMMLRTIGIPSRLVTGYQEGEYVEDEDYYIVRQADAHAWVEAKIGERWVRFDPTPAAGWSTYARGFVREAQRFFDTLAFRWQRYVVAFTTRDQMNLYFAANAEIFRIKTIGVGSWLKEITNRYGWLLVVVFIPAFWMQRRRFLSFFKRDSRPKKIKKQLNRHFCYLLKILSKSGVGVGPSTTPGELVTRAANRFPAARSELETWLSIYHPIRYGGRQATLSDLLVLTRTAKAVRMKIHG